MDFVEEQAVPDTFNVVLFGPMGSGKSTAAATAPGPILWVNAEGRGSIQYARKIARSRHTEIREVRLVRKADPRQQLRDLLSYVKNAESDAPATVVIDTVGKLRDLLADVLVRPGSRDTRDQWGEVANILGTVCYDLFDLPGVNVVLIAHESVEDADGDRIVRPQIGGVLTERIPAAADVVGYCGVIREEETDSVRYAASLVEISGRRAKDRSGGLGTLRDLDLSEWLTTYRAALEAPAAPVESPEDVQWGDDPKLAAALQVAFAEANRVRPGSFPPQKIRLSLHGADQERRREMLQQVSEFAIANGADMEKVTQQA